MLAKDSTRTGPPEVIQFTPELRLPGNGMVNLLFSRNFSLKSSTISPIPRATAYRDGRRAIVPGRFMVKIRRHSLPVMELITILNRCHRFRGFVYQHAYFSADKRSIEVVVRPRKGSTAVCSRCYFPASGYD